MKLNAKSGTTESLYKHNSNSSNNNNGIGNVGNNEYQYASNRGVNAIQSNSTFYQPSTYNQSSSQSSSHIQSPSSLQSQISNQNRRVGDATSNNIYERSAIESLCVPGGLRPVPPDDELQDFLNVAPTLSADIVGMIVFNEIKDKSDIYTYALLS